MTAERRLWIIVTSAAIVAVMATSVQAADEKSLPESTWYVVGDRLDRAALGEDRLTADALTQRVQLGLTYSNTPGTDVLAVTASPGTGIVDETTGYSFLVAGAYDWRTGSIVTPRIMAGVGFSYLDQGRPGDRVAASSVRDDLAPTFQLGFGANFDVGDSWGFTAEYQAFYRGATELEGRLGDPEVSQKFMLGAKVRF